MKTKNNQFPVKTKIPLSNSKKFAIVDDKHARLVYQYRWHIDYSNPEHYPINNAKKTKTLGRYIMGLVLQRELNKDEFIIYKDSDYLNCTEKNLLLIKERAFLYRKIKPSKNSTTKYRGVSHCYKRKKFMGYNSRLMFKGKLIYCGPSSYYETAKEAFNWYKKVNKQILKQLKTRDVFVTTCDQNRPS